MYLTIKNGKLEDNGQLLDWIIKAKDGQYVIKEYKKERTTSQNRYLWGCVYQTIADHMGETDLEYIHAVMGQQFLMDYSKKIPYPKSTTKLNTTEFTIYIDKIKNRVSQYGVIIPSAEDYEQSL